MGMLKDNGVGALTFGSEVLRGKVAYPMAPTWALYSGDESRCNDDIPVLLRRSVFCKAFLAEARIFRVYHSWVLSMLLSQVPLPPSLCQHDWSCQLMFKRHGTSLSMTPMSHPHTFQMQLRQFGVYRQSSSSNVSQQ